MGLDPIALLEGTMAMDGVGVPSLWGYSDYNETIEELNQRLHATAMEFEAFQMSAREEMRKKEEGIQRLLHLLEVTKQERDEAREQLQALLKKFMLSNITPELSPLASYRHPESPRARQTRGNSSLTESDSISDTRNHQSYVSSPVDSAFFDADNATEFQTMNMADSQKTTLYNSSSPTSVVGAGMSKIDQAFARLDQLVSSRPLPEKGKLMEAVMKAGPLLQSLLVAGPLPRWKNPPPLQQLQIPPVAVKGRNSQALNQNPSLLQNSLNGLMQGDIGGSFTPKRSMAMEMEMAIPASSGGILPCSSSKRQRSQ